jgi:hypothetical protein
MGGHGLAQRNSTVVGRNQGFAEDPEALRAQAGLQFRQERPILKDPPA